MGGWHGAVGALGPRGGAGGGGSGGPGVGTEGEGKVGRGGGARVEFFERVGGYEGHDFGSGVVDGGDGVDGGCRIGSAD